MSLHIRLPSGSAPALQRRAETLAAAYGDAEIHSSPLRNMTGKTLYYIDALTEALKEQGLTNNRFILDVGDDPSAVSFRSHGLVPRSMLMVPAQAWLFKRAYGVVHRGAAHASLLVSRRSEERRLLYMPDFPVARGPLIGRRARKRGDPITLAFIGTSHLSRKSKPAGWHLIDWLQKSDGSVLFLGIGNGVDKLKTQAKQMGLADRIMFSSNYAAVHEFLAPADAFFLPQSRDRLAAVRTTGKLADYVELNRPIFTSAVGTSATVLPSSMMMAPLPLSSNEYSQELLRLTQAWQDRSESEWQMEESLLAASRQILFDPARTNLWASTMKQWCA